MTKEWLAKAMHEAKYGVDGVYAPSYWQSDVTKQVYSLHQCFEDMPTEYQIGLILVADKIIQRSKLENSLLKHESHSV